MNNYEWLDEYLPSKPGAAKDFKEEWGWWRYQVCFKRGGGDIWWIGLAENKALLELQKELTDFLLAGGFRLESRRFSPHITLAREVRLTAQPDRNVLLGKSFSTRVGGRLTYTEQYRKE